MENKTRDQVELLFEKFTEYVETRVNLYKLQAVDKSSDVISSVFSKMLVVLVFAMFVFIINIGIALLLGELLGKAWYGFFILSGFYLITGIIFNYMNSKWFKEPLTDKIIQKFLK